MKMQGTQALWETKLVEFKSLIALVQPSEGKCAPLKAEQIWQFLN